MRKNNNKQALADYFHKNNQTPPVTFESLHISTLFEPPKDTPLPNEETAPLQFTTLGQSPLWQQQSEYYQKQGIAVWQQNEVPSYITNSPSMVNAYAKLIIHYLLDAIHNGVIDVEQPVRLLELGAGSGRFAIQLLQCLDTLFQEYGLEQLDFCYVISDFCEKNIDFIVEHPYLLPYIVEGRVQVLNYDVLSTETSDLDSEATLETASVLSGKNPMLVIANYLFSSLPQELLYLHYGELYQGEVALTDISASSTSVETGKSAALKNKQEKSTPLYYRWKKQPDLSQWLETQPESLREVLQTYLTQCLNQCHSQQLLLPTGVLTCLTNLQRYAPQGMLLLNADFGEQEQQELRYLTCPDHKRDDYFPLPVNFDCINHWLAAQEATKYSVQHSNGGLILNAAILHGDKRSNIDDYPLTEHAFEQYLSQYNPDDYFQIKHSLHGAKKVLTEDQQLAYFRLSHYDPKVLALFLPELLENGVSINMRHKWCIALTKIWHNYIPIGEQDDFSFKLGLLAINLKHWALAQACFINCLHWYGDSIALFYNLALVAHATDQTELAELSIHEALNISAEDKQTVTLAKEIKQYQKYCEEVSWYSKRENIPLESGLEPETESEPIAYPGLSVVPISTHHIGEFWLQYRDPQIAALSRNYQLTSVEACKATINAWQQQGAEGEYGLFAVVDKQLGFIGCTALSFETKLSFEADIDPELDSGDLGDSDDSTVPDTNLNPYQHAENNHKKPLKTAYFSFWIGTDYQGKGFALPAVKLCINQAKLIADRGELDFLITSAWQHNHRSVRVLEKAGFVVLDCKKGEEVEHELFYCLPLLGQEFTDELRGRVNELVRLDRESY